MAKKKEKGFDCDFKNFVCPMAEFSCPVAEDWPEHRKEAVRAMQQVENTHNMIAMIHQDTKHLETIANTLVDLKGKFVDAALGKEIVPIGVTQTMLEEQRKGYTTIIKVLCSIFTIIVLVLVGLKYLSPHILGGG